MHTTGRYVFIGDIHGCYEELCELLQLVNPGRQDTVVALGDFLDRGPQPMECLNLWKIRGYKAVRGNHDQRAIDWLAGKNVPDAEDFPKTRNMLLKNKELCNYLVDIPFYIHFEDINTVAVHAALDVNKRNLKDALDSSRDIMTRGRYVRKRGNDFQYVELGKDRPGDSLWSNFWNIDTRIMYGHTPSMDGNPVMINNTVCLDTGCVYGKCLSAAIFDPASGRLVSASVRSRREYWRRANREDIVII